MAGVVGECPGEETATSESSAVHPPASARQWEQALSSSSPAGSGALLTARVTPEEFERQRERSALCLGGFQLKPVP